MLAQPLTNNVSFVVDSFPLLRGMCDYGGCIAFCNQRKILATLVDDLVLVHVCVSLVRVGGPALPYIIARIVPVGVPYRIEWHESCLVALTLHSVVGFMQHRTRPVPAALPHKVCHRCHLEPDQKNRYTVRGGNTLTHTYTRTQNSCQWTVDRGGVNHPLDSRAIIRESVTGQSPRGIAPVGQSSRLLLIYVRVPLPTAHFLRYSTCIGAPLLDDSVITSWDHASFIPGVVDGEEATTTNDQRQRD